MGPFVVLTVVATALLLLCERRGSRRGVWWTKPAASIGFLGVALAAGALDSGYGIVVLIALVLCLAGDVLLIPREAPRVFQLGVLSFLLGHVAYVVAFALLGIDFAAAGLALIVALAPVVVVLRWLGPHLPDDMRAPVRAYVGVITAMVVAAVGAVAAGAPSGIAVGALLFYFSDISVARDRFVAPGFVNGAWGLPAYYAGQLVLAATVG